MLDGEQSDAEQDGSGRSMNQFAILPGTANCSANVA